MTSVSAEERVHRALTGLAIDANQADVIVIRNTPIHMHVEAGTRPDEHLIAARACANVLTRVFHNVTLSGVEPARLLPSRHPGLPRPPVGGQAPAQVVAFTDQGVGTTYGGAQVRYADNRGWTAYLSTEKPFSAPIAPKNLLAAYFAGCWAASDVFNSLFARILPRAQPASATHTFDLLTFEDDKTPRLSPDLNGSLVVLDDVCLAGVGSIGQAFVEAIGYVPQLRGSLHLIDPEDTDESNESRYVLSFPHNRGAAKVHIAMEHLQNLHPLLRVEAGIPIQTIANVHVTSRSQGVEVKVAHRTFQPATYEAVMRVRKRPFRTVAVAVDSSSVRRDIQMGLHRTVLNSWSNAEDGQMAYSVGHHRLDGQLACMACLYHSSSPHEPSAVDFAAAITRWPLEKVLERLVTNPAHPTSEEEVKELSLRRGLPVEMWSNLVDKPLADVIHHACGLASLSVGDRNVVSPVAHVTALAGSLLAVLVVREAMGLPMPANLVTFDSLRLPTSLGMELRIKSAGCMCGDADVQAVYAREWA